MLSSKNIQKLGFLIMICGFFYFQVIKGDYYANRARSNYIRLIPKLPSRGIIYDRNQKPLVKNKIQFRVCLFSNDNISQIARILGVSPDSLQENFNHNFVASFIPTPVYTTSSRSEILQLEEKNFPQVSIQIQPRRNVVYPYNLAHLIGYTRKPSKKQVFLQKYGYNLNEYIGFTGIEKYYDDYLRGKTGGIQLEVNAQGKTINILGQKTPVSGKDIHTTIDIDIQNAAYQTLKGNRGSLILMDANTGAIISMVSSPSLDINRFTTEPLYLQYIQQRKDNPLLNRPIQGEYPPGSVFKPVVALAGLEEKKISKTSEFLCNGKFKLKKASFKCWNVHGWENVVEGLAHSCNVFFYNLGLLLGERYIHEYALKLNLGKPTQIDLPFERRGFIPSKKWKQTHLKQPWYLGDTVNFSIGQGYVLTTPIQIAKMMSLFATRGYLLQPYLVAQIEDIQTHINIKETVNADLANIDLINQGLREAVHSPQGTAHILDKLGLSIAGKTGTAQVYRHKSHGWFAGFFPYENPKYIVVCMLENTGSSYNSCVLTYNFLKTLKESKLLNPE